MTRTTPRRNPMVMKGKEGMRLAIMILITAVLAGAVFLESDKIASWLAGGKGDEGTEIPSEPIAVVYPKINTELLAKTKEETSFQRYETEPEIYEHLLVTASNLTPGALTAMGLERGSVQEIRNHPDRYRGKPLWFEGKIAQLGRPEPIPGLYKTTKTEGLLALEGGELVKFAVTTEVPDGLALGSDARIEGIFYKLMDQRFGTQYEKAPFLVGPALRKAFLDFEPVKKLDPEVLNLARDSSDAEMTVIEPIPLYHLTSYVMNLDAGKEWRRDLPPLTREEASKLVGRTEPRLPRGTGFRIVAALYWVRSIAAEPNPLGVKWWTDAWVAHRTCGTIQIRFPGRIRGKWKTGDYVVAYGCYLKNYLYEVGNEKWKQALQPGTFTRETLINRVPYFVADELLRWKLVHHPSDKWFSYGLTAVTALLVGLLCFLVYRDNKADKQVMRRLMERRRKRLEKQRT